MSASLASKWDFAFVLPQLVLPSAKGSSASDDWPNGLSFAPDLVAIVPQSDGRVRSLRRSSAGLRQILRSFRDEYGRPYAPAVMLLSRRLPDAVRNDLSSSVGFRNAIAMSAVLRARAAHVRGHGRPYPTWSETFDFHSAQLNRHDRMVLQSPARLGLVSERARLIFTPDAALGFDAERMLVDHYLLEGLGRAWRALFVKGKGRSPYLRRLFRSLDVAYAAAGIADRSQGSIHEYGLQVAQWVSAIEILARPEGGKVGHEEVLRFLGTAPARVEFTKRRYRARVGKRARPLSTIERAYTYLYHARNAFLHGNPVGGSTLHTRTGKRTIGLPLLASLVYRIALVAYLNRRYRKEPSWRTFWTRSFEVYEQFEYDEALADAFGLSLP